MGIKYEERCFAAHATFEISLIRQVKSQSCIALNDILRLVICLKEFCLK